jgi:hypothetical protein
MRRLLLGVGLCVVSALAQAGQGTVSVGTNSACVLQAVVENPSGVSAWTATNAVQNGELRLISGALHMCLVGGTTSNTAPAVTGSLDVGDGAVTWRPAGTVKRQALLLGNAGTNDLYISFGARAAPTGFALPTGALLVFSGAETPQTALHAVRAAGSGNVTLTWW